MHTRTWLVRSRFTPHRQHCLPVRAHMKSTQFFHFTGGVKDGWMAWGNLFINTILLWDACWLAELFASSSLFPSGNLHSTSDFHKRYHFTVRFACVCGRMSRRRNRGGYNKKPFFSFVQYHSRSLARFRQKQNMLLNPWSQDRLHKSLFLLHKSGRSFLSSYGTMRPVFLKKEPKVLLCVP